MRYRLLAARQEQEFSAVQMAMVSVIGRESSCLLESFAAWAKVGLSAEDGQRLLLELKARKVKLSPGELAFMKSGRAEAVEGIGPRTLISFDHTEGRAVGGLERKGFVVRHKGEAEITDLGSAWLRNAAEARIAS